jgi:hypothetical protein
MPWLHGLGIDKPGHDKPVFCGKPLSFGIFGCQLGTEAGLDNGVLEDSNSNAPDNDFILILQIKIPAAYQKIRFIYRMAHCFSDTIIGFKKVFRPIFIGITSRLC